MDSVFQRLGLELDWRAVLMVSTLILMRVMMVISTIPFLVGKPVPNQVRMGLGLIFLLFLYPAVAPASINALPKDIMTLMLLYMKEGFFGLAIGMASGMIFYAFDAAGRLIDNQRGAAQARVFVPQIGQVSLFGALEFQLGVVLFLTMGGHLAFLKAFIESFEFLPIFAFPAARTDFLALGEIFIRMSGNILLVAMQLTAPIIIAIFLVDVILGMVNRLAPPINVWEMSFSIRGYIGVLVTFLALGMITNQMGHEMGRMMLDLKEVMQVFAP